MASNTYNAYYGNQLATDAWQTSGPGVMQQPLGGMTVAPQAPQTGGVNTDNPYGNIESMSAYPTTTVVPPAPTTGGWFDVVGGGYETTNPNYKPPGYNEFQPLTGGVNTDSGGLQYDEQTGQWYEGEFTGPDGSTQKNYLSGTFGDPNQTMESGINRYDPNTNYSNIDNPADDKNDFKVCFDPSSPYYNKQWCIDARDNPYSNVGKVPPWGTGSPDSTNPDGTPTVPAGSYNPNTPPQYPGGTPNVDPYDIGSSPDYSGFDFEGVSPVNPQADPFDYGQVSDFADAAWEQSMRYLEPQFQTEDRRHEQMLINKGLDPNSEAGMEALRRKEVGQNDLLSKSAFDALGFGTDLQNQMFGQDATRSGFANDMMQALMGLGQRGHEFDTTAGLNANQQAFAQMLALEGLDYRDYMTLIDQMRYDDSLALSLLGMGAAPSYQTVRTGLSDAPFVDLSNSFSMWNTPLFGGG